MAKVMGLERHRVSRAIKQLGELGALTIPEGGMKEQQNAYSRAWDWVERPTIMLAPELRALGHADHLGKVLKHAF
jgi:hypothetical protein